MGAAASSAEGSGGVGPATDAAAAAASSPKMSLCELKGTEADKWRSLVGELESICKEHQASLAEGRHGGGGVAAGRVDSPSGRTPRSTPPRSPPSRVRGSSILKKESSFTGSTDDAPPPVSDRRRSSSVVILDHAANLNVLPTSLPNANDMPRSPTSCLSFDVEHVMPGPGVEPKRKPRSQTMALRKQRKEFFDDYMESTYDPESGLQCTYAGLVCAAISFLLSVRHGAGSTQKKLTLEDVFFATQMPLHYLGEGTVSLAELRDMCEEFINHDPRLKGVVTVEAVHMESTLLEGEVEQGERANESGDRGPMPLSDFRKSIESEMKEASSCRIYNFDPFVVDQELTHIDDTDSDEEAEDVHEDAAPFNEMTSMNSADGPAQALDGMKRYKHGHVSQVQAQNNGRFSLATDFNSARNTVTLAEASVDQDIHLATTDVPIDAIYKACCTKDRITKRCRGYLLFSLVVHDEDEEESDVKELFPSDLNLGHGPNGIPLASVRGCISKHLVAMAYGLHLIRGFETQESGNGLDVKELAVSLDFPTSVMVGYDMPILEAFAYYEHFLKQSDYNVWASVQPIEKKVNSEHSPPSLSIMDLHEVLVKAASQMEDLDKVMIMQFDLSCVHNKLNIAAPGTSHYGVLQSYDVERQEVTILDIEPKKYGRVWGTTLQRLHRAMIGKGYVFLYQSSLVRDTSDEDDMRTMEELQQLISARRHDTFTGRRIQNLRMRPGLPTPFLKFFEYPTEVMPVTSLAVALNLLRPSQLVLAKDVIQNVSCDPALLVDSDVTANDLERIGTSYIVNTQQADVLRVQAVNFDQRVSDGNRKVTLASFEEILDKATEASRACAGEPKEVFILNCKASVLERWGAGCGGEFLIFHEVATDDDGRKVVTASDLNPCLYQRYLRIPLSELYEACCEPSALNCRARGYLRLSAEATPPRFLIEDGCKDVAIFNVPQWEQFRQPQSTHLSGIALALTTMGHTCCSEEVFYRSYTCLGGERFRRGSAIFPWHTLKISMCELQERMTVTAVARMVMKFEHASQHCLQASIVVGSTEEDFEGLVEEVAQPECKFLVVVIVNTEPIHDINLTHEGQQKYKLGCGVIKGYDSTTKTVDVVDANPTRYGAVWSCSVEQLYHAAELNSTDATENGLIKIGKTTTGMGAKRKSVVESNFEF